MMEVRENEIALRKLSGGTLTLEGTLILTGTMGVGRVFFQGGRRQWWNYILQTWKVREKHFSNKLKGNYQI